MQPLCHTSNTKDGNMAFRYGQRNEVLENRRRLVLRLGLSPERCVVMDSPHEDIVTVLDEHTDQNAFGLGSSLAADTLITRLPNTPLLLTTADCLPITLVDPTTHTIALMHLSRHTFCLGLVEKTLATLTTMFRVRTEDLTITIGPHIHKDSYSFRNPLSVVDPRLAPYIEVRGNRSYIDLSGAALTAFTHHGIALEQIHVSAIHTYRDPHYFSHVREVELGETEGRLITVACLVGSQPRS